MRVYMFTGGGQQGFTLSEAGRNLPSEHGPWEFFKIINMIRGVERHTDLALLDIAEQGYHIKLAGGSDGEA